MNTRSSQDVDKSICNSSTGQDSPQASKGKGFTSSFWKLDRQNNRSKQRRNVENISVRIRRGDDQRVEYMTYAVPTAPFQTVLDVVTYVQRYLDASLSYRFACRVGMCGSCAMTVNGIPRWTCRTRVLEALTNGALTLEPLSNFPIVKDLVVDMKEFFSKWQAAGGVFEGEDPQSQTFAKVVPNSTSRQQVDAGIECIGCGVCYAACDTVRWDSDYLGPAALNRAWTLIKDVRDRARRPRLQKVTQKGGCQLCHSHQSCQRYCPKKINPAAAIAGLKREAVYSMFKNDNSDR